VVIMITVEVWRTTSRLVAPCGQRWWTNDDLLEQQWTAAVKHARACETCVAKSRGIDRNVPIGREFFPQATPGTPAAMSLLSPPSPNTRGRKS
jgi:hypothetical protein